jgi:hypothetical protein
MWDGSLPTIAHRGSRKNALPRFIYADAASYWASSELNSWSSPWSVETIDRAADRFDRRDFYGRTSRADRYSLSLRPKKRGPFHLLPVIAKATLERLSYVWPFQAKRSAITKLFGIADPIRGRAPCRVSIPFASDRSSSDARTSPRQCPLSPSDRAPAWSHDRGHRNGRPGCDRQ